MAQRSRDGRIVLILGPMFSGKSTELCRRYKRDLIAELRTVIIKYDGDTRYSKKDIVTHDGTGVQATSCSRLMELELDPAEYDSIYVDEIQFYPDKLEFCEKMANSGVIVTCCGLLSDWQRRPFAQMAELQAVSFSIETLVSICFYCKQENACYTYRTSAETDVEVIGGADKYHAVCRTCYMGRTAF